jgi:hypothetical protein
MYIDAVEKKAYKSSYELDKFEEIIHPKGWTRNIGDIFEGIRKMSKLTTISK